MAVADKITIEIDGSKIHGFLRLSIHQRMYQPHEFSLVCPREVFEKSPDSPLSKSINKIGSGIIISIESINSGLSKKDFHFKGIITGVSASESPTNQEITFSGHSPDILLHGYPTCRSFENKTLQEIANLVMQPYPQDQISLTGTHDNNTRFPFIVQYKESDYEFLCRLARRFGLWFFHNGMKLVFGSFQRSAVNGTLGINLMDFQIGADLAPLNFEFCHFQWNENNLWHTESKTKDITGNLDSIGKRVHDQSLSRFPETGNYYFPHFFDNEDGTRIEGQPNPVLQEKQSIGSRFIVVAGTSYESLQLGNVLKIKALNNDQKIDVGDFLITGINHGFDNSMNYSNSFTGIPNSLQLSPNASVKAAVVCETQAAQVYYNDDPQKLGRVKVRFIWQEENQTSPWIRVATQSAMGSHGFYFTPEKEEFVLVAFEGGDPQNPYIIGSLYDGARKPDENWVTQSNDMKAIRSRSGHTIEFNDANGKEELCIYNGSRKDPSNMMRLKVSNNGYEIFSKGPINLTSNDDINLKGKNINVEASEKLKLEGQKEVNLLTFGQGKILISNGGAEIQIGETSDLHVKVPAEAKFAFAVGELDNRIEAGIEGIDITGPKVSVKADALAEISGALVKIN